MYRQHCQHLMEHQPKSRDFGSRRVGATENAGVENAIRSKLQGWKMQDWKKQELMAWVENAGVSRMEHQTKVAWKES